MSRINYTKLKRELRIDAKALGIPSGAADLFIDRALAAADQALSRKTIITDHDLKSAIAKELRKYHKDFAYVYQNRDKIV